MDVSKECVEYIKSIGNIGQCIAEVIQPALQSGFKGYEFTENDLKYLQAKYAEVFDVWNNLPDVESSVRCNRPIGCALEYKTGEYPCNECEADAGGCCQDLKEINQRIKEFKNADS